MSPGVPAKEEQLNVRIVFQPERVSGIVAIHVDMSRTGVKLLIEHLLSIAASSPQDLQSALAIISSLNRVHDHTNFPRQMRSGDLEYEFAGVSVKIPATTRVLLERVLRETGLARLV